MLASYSWIILAFAPIVAEYSSRPAVISWDPLFPRTGTLPGTIEVKGIALPNKGWKLDGKKVFVEVWPRGGGVAQSFEVEVKAGIWGPAMITGFSPTDSYNIFVDVPFTNGTKRITLRTGARVVSAR